MYKRGFLHKKMLVCFVYILLKWFSKLYHFHLCHLFYIWLLKSHFKLWTVWDQTLDMKQNENTLHNSLKLYISINSINIFFIFISINKIYKTRKFEVFLNATSNNFYAFVRQLVLWTTYLAFLAFSDLYVCINLTQFSKKAVVWQNGLPFHGLIPIIGQFTDEK